MRKRTGTLIMLAGVLLAVFAAMLVLGIVRQAHAERVAQVKQVLVVMAAKDIADGTAISADALSMQPFPADFVPSGAIAAPEQAVGKYTTTHITKGQIVLDNQLSPTKRAGELSLSVPSGKVAVALPLDDLMSANGAIKAGDHVDVLLTVDLKEVQIAATGQAIPASSDNAKNPVTQTTLQDVEVLAIGQAVDQQSNSGNSGITGTSATTAGNTAGGATAKGAVILLLDPQDALVLKYAKDSGGVVDLALRAADDNAQVKTDPVTIDHLFERFNFQRPGPVP